MMKCRNRNCGALFCWTCLQPHEYGLDLRRYSLFINVALQTFTPSSHFVFSSCNRYIGDSLPGDSGTDCNKNTHRYLFFHDRYVNHTNSLKFECKLQTKMKMMTDTVLKLQQSNLTPMDVRVQLLSYFKYLCIQSNSL